MKFPNKVNLYEVGPRDGLQNEKDIIPTEIKIKLINKLINCNFKAIEIGSFVSPRWVPQMADSDIIMDKINRKKLISLPVLTPNLKGLQKAIEKKVDTVCVFITASESFSKKNTNCSVSESIKRVEGVIREAKKNNIKVRGYLSCVLGCPYEGKVSYKKTADLSRFLIEQGCYQISLGDTIGCGTPLEAVKLFEAVSKTVNIESLAAHFHDTYGQALSNIYAVLQMGVQTLDTSISGLGGCPYAKGATGNVATEDVLYMLNGMGISTGVKLEKILEVSKYINRYLNRMPSSRVAMANFNK
ncbi:MAG: hydroxymethylglutaryl-CoA lyase [Pelagibacterales bacterium]|nr:hydroxymethylglutaryl-CoA lyase [Pelagibacterales bacterium]OUU62118.1 MAG: hydroxymethylglutaryl-CoA lyase [Alphaproteobacteria bacterium TMED62]|tara:strand:- start:1006 stop:1905 length:900 start_codon:yes stop_codon:yes gene_type:complete